MEFSKLFENTEENCAIKVQKNKDNVFLIAYIPDLAPGETRFFTQDGFEFFARANEEEKHTIKVRDGVLQIPFPHYYFPYGSTRNTGDLYTEIHYGGIHARIEIEKNALIRILQNETARPSFASLFF